MPMIFQRFFEGFSWWLDSYETFEVPGGPGMRPQVGWQPEFAGLK